MFGLAWCLWIYLKSMCVEVDRNAEMDYSKNQSNFTSIHFNNTCKLIELRGHLKKVFIVQKWQLSWHWRSAVAWGCAVQCRIQTLSAGRRRRARVWPPERTQESARIPRSHHKSTASWWERWIDVHAHTHLYSTPDLPHSHASSTSTTI